MSLVVVVCNKNRHLLGGPVALICIYVDVLTCDQNWFCTVKDHAGILFFLNRDFLCELLGVRLFNEIDP